jgi:hypothetical protein
VKAEETTRNPQIAFSSSFIEEVKSVGVGYQNRTQGSFIQGFVVRGSGELFCSLCDVLSPQKIIGTDPLLPRGC